MTTISTHGANHSSSLAVTPRVEAGLLLRDEDAAPIASWYQTPRGHGLTFARLAQGSPVDLDDLLDAVVAEMVSGEHGDHLAELQALAIWARAQAPATGEVHAYPGEDVSPYRHGDDTGQH